MKFNNTSLLALLFPILSGCQFFDNDGQNKVRYLLKDSSSAEFRNSMEFIKDGRTVYCGEVNAKNSMGALTGFVRYIVIDRVVVIGEEVSVFNEGASSTDLVIANTNISVLKLKAENIKLEEEIRQKKANFFNPTPGTKTIGEAAWEIYCSPPPQVLSLEEKCKRDHGYSKSIYNMQMNNAEYSKAARVKLPDTCSNNHSITEEVKAMASDAELKRLIELASGSNNIINQRVIAISKIKKEFPQKAGELRDEIDSWEANVKKQNGRRFTADECYRMKLLIPSVARDIGMRQNIASIMDDANNSDTPQVHDAMLKWVTQYDAPSLIEHSYEMATTFWNACKNGKIRNGFKPK